MELQILRAHGVFDRGRLPGQFGHAALAGAVLEAASVFGPTGDDGSRDGWVVVARDVLLAARQRDHRWRPVGANDWFSGVVRSPWAEYL